MEHMRFAMKVIRVEPDFWPAFHSKVDILTAEDSFSKLRRVYLETSLMVVCLQTTILVE